jgi:hypothetical protein
MNANSFLSWESLTSFTGCVAAVGITVQFTKTWLDKYVKVPTQLYTYLVALVILIATDLFTQPLNIGNLALDVLDAVLVSLSANGAYHLFSDSLSDKNENI